MFIRYSGICTEKELHIKFMVSTDISLISIKSGLKEVSFNRRVGSIPGVGCEEIVFCPIVLFSYCLNKVSKYTVVSVFTSGSLLIEIRIHVTFYLSVLLYTNLFFHPRLPFSGFPSGSFRTNKSTKNRRDTS